MHSLSFKDLKVEVCLITNLEVQKERKKHPYWTFWVYLCSDCPQVTAVALSSYCRMFI